MRHTVADSSQARSALRPCYTTLRDSTVSRWAQEGRLPFFRTLGGHRRYPDAEIRALLETLSELSPAG
jgi:excisionase family DNA binding protein